LKRFTRELLYKPDSDCLIIFDRVISTDPALREAEATIPDLPCKELIIAGLTADSVFELTFMGPNVTNPAVTAPPGH
jgi:hypothetical protein